MGTDGTRSAASRTRRRGTGPVRDPAVDDAVRRATRELLVEKGYARVSVDSIATRAGVGRPALYRRWPSKAHIVHDAVYPDLSAFTDRWWSDDVRADLTALVRGSVALFADPVTREAVPGLIADGRADPDRHRMLVTEPLVAIRAAVAARLDAARAAGDDLSSLPHTDVDTLVDTVAGAAIFAFSVRDRADVDAVADGLAVLVLGPDPEAAPSRPARP